MNGGFTLGNPRRVNIGIGIVHGAVALITVGTFLHIRSGLKRPQALPRGIRIP